MIMPLLLLVAIGGLLRAARGFVPEGELREPVFAATLAFGFVLLAAFFAGRVVERLRMPRITGYLLAGVIAGPYALRLLSEPVVKALGLVDGTAVCLIALTAGGELNIAKLRPLLRVVRSMTVLGVLGTAVLLTLATVVLSPLLPWLGRLPLSHIWVVALLLGITLASQSPAVVMAMLDETRSDGPLSQTTLALVVLSDLVVIVLFAVASAMANVVFGGSVDPWQTALSIGWELFGSMVVGLVIAIIMAFYLANVETGRALFVLVVCVVVAEVGRRLHLDPLIVMLTVGVFLENVTRVGAEEITHEIEAASLPVYLVFFAVAGAILRVDLLSSVAVPTAVLVAVRTVGFWYGCRKAGQRTGAPDTVTRFTWVGLLPQAGLALALALLLKRSFPEFGGEAAVLVLSVVGVNQLVSPILLRIALLRSGEAGSRASADPTPSAPRVAPEADATTR